jgi:flagellar L-ring protein precursor FlgH
MNNGKFFRFVTASMLASLAPIASAQMADSLVDPATYRSLAADQRAYRVGDVITVYVLEATRAKSQAATDAGSNTVINAGLDSPSTNWNASVGINGASGGSGQTTRVGELRAQISAQVTAVAPDGTLRIEGTQLLTVNGERQKIRVGGLVRPQDIAADNTVLSNRIANADLELVGVGVVSESQRQGVLYRIFKWLRLM